MNTILYKPTKEEINKAGEIILNGGLIAFPTETVYGLGANGLDAKASEKIYAAKGRPSDNPLIVHIASIESLGKIVADIPENAIKLAREFWPGPLTMILNKADCVPYETTGGLDTVAVRMPDNEIALKLIEAGGGYVAAPSANLSGKPSPTMAEHVMEDMNGRIDGVIDGGMVGIGIESTIIDLSGEIPMILRPGYINREMIGGIIGEVLIDPAIATKEKNDARPKAPGMKYKHYSPEADICIVEGSNSAVVETINKLIEKKEAEGIKCGIIASEENVPLYRSGVIKNIGSKYDDDMIAHNLYRLFREFDKEGVDYIYSEAFEEGRIGQAIMNRLIKAAGYNKLKV